MEDFAVLAKRIETRQRKCAHPASQRQIVTEESGMPHERCGLCRKIMAMLEPGVKKDEHHN